MAVQKSRQKKWLANIPAQSGIDSAAAQVLEVRFNAVLDYLPLAIFGGDKGKHNVHQLRVATRRAVAAIDVLADVLPRKRVDRVRRLLCQIRRHFGKARDLDVMIARLLSSATDDVDPNVRAAVLVDLESRRKAAQLPLASATQNFDVVAVQRKLDKLRGGVEWRGEGSPLTWYKAARAKLKGAADVLFAAGMAIADKPPTLADLEAIHRLRIQGKRLRYTMEITVSAVGPPMKQLYPFIANTQLVLGELNDRDVAMRRFQKWQLDSNDSVLIASLKQMAEWEQLELEKALKKFSNWWTIENVGEYRDKWTAMVGSSADDPPWVPS